MAKKIPSRKFSTTKKKIPSRKFPASKKKISSRKGTEGEAQIPSRKSPEAAEAAREGPDGAAPTDHPAQEPDRQERLARLKAQLESFQDAK